MSKPETPTQEFEYVDEYEFKDFGVGSTTVPFNGLTIGKGNVRFSVECQKLFPEALSDFMRFRIDTKRHAVQCFPSTTGGGGAYRVRRKVTSKRRLSAMSCGAKLYKAGMVTGRYKFEREHADGGYIFVYDQSLDK